MKFDIRGRGRGKTTDLVKEVLATRNGILLVAWSDEAARLIHEYPELNKRVVTPTNLHTVRGRFPGGAVVYIDNLELILPLLVGSPVAKVTMNAQEDIGP